MSLELLNDYNSNLKHFSTLTSSKCNFFFWKIWNVMSGKSKQIPFQIQYSTVILTEKVWNSALVFYKLDDPEKYSFSTTKGSFTVP